LRLALPEEVASTFMLVFQLSTSTHLLLSNALSMRSRFAPLEVELATVLEATTNVLSMRLRSALPEVELVTVLAATTSGRRLKLVIHRSCMYRVLSLTDTIVLVLNLVAALSTAKNSRPALPVVDVAVAVVVVVAEEGAVLVMKLLKNVPLMIWNLRLVLPGSTFQSCTFPV
jgi:hypothetical protein